MSRQLRFVLLLLLLVEFASVAHADGGEGASTSDRFAESHRRLLRVADFQLQQMKDARARVEREPPQAQQQTAPTNSGEPTDAFPWIRPEAVAEARQRLRTLGVEADRIFAEEGVPQALLVVAQVESGFDPRAVSAKGARGLWQLMPETAQRFGLRVDAQADERTHPARSTRVAARYLRELYLHFGDWLLALAAYNAGEGRVESAIARAATRNPSTSLRASFWHLAALGLLPEETRRFVPAVLSL